VLEFAAVIDRIIVVAVDALFVALAAEHDQAAVGPADRGLELIWHITPIRDGEELGNPPGADVEECRRLAFGAAGQDDDDEAPAGIYLVVSYRTAIGVALIAPEFVAEGRRCRRKSSSASARA